MIVVLATIELVPGRRDDFVREFKANVPNVLAERGCIEYFPTVDLPTPISAQIPLRPDAVTIVEKWESLAALQDHLVAPHMVSYRTRVKEMVVRTTLQVLDPA